MRCRRSVMLEGYGPAVRPATVHWGPPPSGEEGLSILWYYESQFRLVASRRTARPTTRTDRRNLNPRAVKKARNRPPRGDRLRLEWWARPVLAAAQEMPSQHRRHRRRPRVEWKRNRDRGDACPGYALERIATIRPNVGCASATPIEYRARPARGSSPAPGRRWSWVRGPRGSRR